MYYDLLIKIKNAERAKKESLQTIFSQSDFAIAKILQQTGYIAGAERRNVGKKSFLDIRLKEPKNGEFRISGLRFFSKPSRRMYMGYKELKMVKQNFGLSVLSTSNGVMTNKDARKQKVGGEYLFEIW